MFRRRRHGVARVCPCLFVVGGETPVLGKPTKGKGSLKADLSCCFGFIETRFACFQAAYAARRDVAAAVRLFKAA